MGFFLYCRNIVFQISREFITACVMTKITLVQAGTMSACYTLRLVCNSKIHDISLNVKHQPTSSNDDN